MNLELKNLSSNIISNKPFIISGPCSAESQDQLLKTAIELKKINVDVFTPTILKMIKKVNIIIVSKRYLKNLIIFIMSI